jgi:putative redox protein
MADPQTSPSPHSTTDKPDSAVRVTWAGEQRFDAGRPNGVLARMDASGKTGPSPVDTLLNAIGGCASADVVAILAKRRTPVKTLTVDVLAKRVHGTPRRLEHVTMAFTISGDGIDREHAERAIELSITKYCSVRDSLRQDIPVEWTLTLVPAEPA